MNSKAPIYMFVALVVVAIGMLIFAATRGSLQESELSGVRIIAPAGGDSSIIIRTDEPPLGK